MVLISLFSWFLAPGSSLHKLIHCLAVPFVAGAQYRRGEFVMVDGIGEVLSLEAYSSLHIVGASALADVLLHIVAGIYLHAGAVCPYLHGARAAREDCGFLQRMLAGVPPGQCPAVVDAAPRCKEGVVYTVAYHHRRTEIHRRSLYRRYLPRRKRVGVVGDILIGEHLQTMVADVALALAF